MRIIILEKSWIAIFYSCSLAQVKTEATDGYTAVQVGYQVVNEKKITKPELNHLKKSGALPMRKLREYRVRHLVAL